MAASIDSIWARVPHRSKSDPRGRDDLMKKKRVLIVVVDETVTRVLVRFLEGTDHYDVIAINDPTRLSKSLTNFAPTSSCSTS